MSRSTDGGGQWVPVSFGSADIGEVLDLEFTSDTQVEATVRILPDCALTVVTSYTAGEFWEATPERLSEATYHEVGSESVTVRGTTSESPCTDVADILSAGTRALVHCSDGLYVSDAASSDWEVLSLVPALAAAVGEDGAPVLAAIRNVPGCESLGIRQYDLEAVPEDGSDIACVDDGRSDGSVGLALRGDDAMIWSGESVFTSDDQGITWSSAA